MNIIPHQLSGILVPQQQDNGYINATALAKAHYEATGQRRDVADWLRNKRTKETISHLSGVTGIPVTELVQVFQGGLSTEQGTYIHPKLATRFAVWLSDDIGYQVECWVEEWLTAGQNPVASREVAGAFDVAERFKRFLLDTGIDPKIAAQIGLNHVERTCPSLKPAVDESKAAIGLKDATENQYLTPTELSDRLSQAGYTVNAREVNAALESIGLQHKIQDAKGRSKWDLTELGKDYGIVFLASGQNSRWSGGQVKWMPSVIQVLRQHLRKAS